MIEQQSRSTLRAQLLRFLLIRLGELLVDEVGLVILKNSRTVRPQQQPSSCVPPENWLATQQPQKVKLLVGAIVRFAELEVVRVSVFTGMRHSRGRYSMSLVGIHEPERRLEFRIFS